MLELERIQSNILRGFRRGTDPAVEHFIFLRFTEAEVEYPAVGGDRAPGARHFIKTLLHRVTSCAQYDRGAGCVLNIGLTYAAVDLFGYGGEARSLDERDDEATGTIEAFKQGMKARAESILGDIEGSAPKHWLAAFKSTIHAVVCLNARAGHVDALEDLKEEVLDAIASSNATVVKVHEETGAAFTGQYAGTEQFGYADGIAQPTIYESRSGGSPGDGTPRKRRGWDPLQPGEFVLGHIDESGQIQFRSQFFKNGSFMVFRKLQQDVALFREYTAEIARRRSVTPEYVGAKMIGRWPSGAPLVLSPDEDDPELGADPERNNDFRYAKDPDGLRCPLGAHIRRNNPREDPSGPGAVQTRLHRIIRRAIPYGPRLPEGQPDDGVERGVIFVVINADIARQFEFVQQNWVNSVLSSTKLTLPQDRDPIIGQQLRDRDTGEYEGKYLIPSSKRNEAPMIGWGLPTFVTTRGGAYFLLPSLDALWNVAHGVDCPELEQEPDEVPEGPEQPDPPDAGTDTDVDEHEEPGDAEAAEPEATEQGEGG